MRMQAVPIKGTSQKAIVSIPGWVEQDSGGIARLTKTDVAYSKVSLTFRAVSLRCDSLVSIPYYITRNGSPAEWPFTQNLDELLWKTEAALLLTGTAYWLKLRNRVALLGPQWLNPYTVTIEYVNGQRVFTQRIGSKTYGPWTDDEVTFFRTFNPSDDVGAGIGAAEVAIDDAATLRAMRQFTMKFFSDGAMPVTILGLAGDPPREEVERVESYFNRAMTGLKNAFKVLAVRSDDIVATPLQQPLTDLAMVDVRNSAIEDVAWAFGIPKTMLMDAANYATAKEHRVSFFNDTILPRLRLLQPTVNKFLEGTGYELEFAPQEHPVFQTDENERAVSLQALRSAGMPLALAMQILGYDLPEGWSYDDLVEKQSEPQDNEDNNRTGDLAKWERKALKRLRVGKSAQCGFNSDFLSEYEISQITTQLANVQNETDLSTLFETFVQ